MQTNVSEIDVTEAILEKVNGLSENQQQQVLEFIKTLDISEKSIWDRLDERLKNVPQEEFAELPVDASTNLDHYLYGAPKK